ncbi:amino acid permease [Shimazuella kribbensis]|uniref:amino acid permease n=1 Tax=Shimazuella kribbensis TaxID=139808 RepID=UPI0003FAEEDA|nr:amino acid permease [Shimazuella kribbensis]
MSKQQEAIFERENDLQRKLSQRQLTMIAIGGAVGTGLFMGSGIAISYAGPGVLISYAIAALIALTMMMCLSEMTMAHPTSGSFGSHAERYIGPWAGYLVRYTYWGAQVIAIGGEATAVALYMKYWFPAVPAWLWIIVFAAVIIFVNARSVNNFGAFEYWFSTIKVTAIIVFIILGICVIFGLGTEPTGISNYTSNGGFMPNGFSGVWMAVLMAIFSFYGVEVVAVTAGEAKDPQKAIPKAMRTMVFRLIIFYILSLGIMLAVVPWEHTGAHAVTESPFVKVFASLGIPYAAGIMNFVVLTAALSSMNTNLYLCSRMIFSLGRGGYTPKALGKLNKRGVPFNALLASSVGLAIAMLLNVLTPNAFGQLFGISIFGGIFVWIMIFITFLRFRKENGKLQSLSYHAPLHPIPAFAGLLLLIGIMVTMLFSADWQYAWYFGAPWIVLVLISYYFYGRRANQ